MKNKRLYGFLVVVALILMPNAVLADTGLTGSVFQTPTDSYNNSLDTSLKQTIGTNRLVTKKSTYQSRVSSTLSSGIPNSAECRRSGAFQYRQGYKRKAPYRMIKVKKSGHGLPGHSPSASVPELDSSLFQSAFALLIGGVFVLRSRRRQNRS